MILTGKPPTNTHTGYVDVLNPVSGREPGLPAQQRPRATGIRSSYCQHGLGRVSSELQKVVFQGRELFLKRREEPETPANSFDC